MASKAPEEPPLRWTLEKAAKEFDIAKETLRRRLGECHQQPAVDGTYTTRQLVTGLYGDLYGAKLRTQNEQAEKLRIENEVSRGELLSRRELARGFTEVAAAISSRVMACTELPRLAREDILRDLASVPLVLTQTADKQVRLPRGKRRDGDSPLNESAPGPADES
jgi:hypothetical protein